VTLNAADLFAGRVLPDRGDFKRSRQGLRPRGNMAIVVLIALSVARTSVLSSLLTIHRTVRDFREHVVPS